MAVVAFGSVRSAGVTTTAASLAMLWPAGRARLLVEADPAGGTVAAAAGLAAGPGLVSLAAAGRHGAGPELVFEHCQELADGTPVLCAPPGPELARSALAMASGLLARLGELGADAFVDCGRLDRTSGGPDLFKSAELSVLVARPRLADLNSLAAFLEGRPGLARPLLVLVGPGPYPPPEVSGALGLQVVAHLPWGPDEAEAVPGTPPGARHLKRTPLVRALRTLADDLARRLAPASLAPGKPARERSLVEVKP